MATIGTFKKTGNDYTGEIFTIRLQAKGVRLVLTSGASGENAPTHRVLVGRAEIGAAWTKTSNEGRKYLALQLDDAISPAEGVLCTSVVQTYLDLAASGERGKEAAEHLRRERLKW